MKWLITLVVFVLSVVIISFNDKQVLKKKVMGSPGFALVELFTSEGCSSCPQADALAEEIQKKYKDENVLVLGYHVDYWNRLGWKDIYSDPAYTNRQVYYSGLFKLNSIYTPQAIVNGRTEFVGSNKLKLISAIEENLKINPASKISLKTSTHSPGKINITYATTGADILQDQLLILLVQKMATSKVNRGENSGRTLHHINIVRSLTPVSINDKEQNTELILPEGLDKAAIFVAALVQNKKTGNISAVSTTDL